MKKTICLIPIFFCLTLSVSVPTPRAEIYRYTDENGITRFTDDLNTVPVDQRMKADEYAELQSALPAPETPEAPKPSEPIPPVETEADIIAASRRLNTTRNSLEEERIRLIKIQQSLHQAGGTTTSKAQAKQHMDRVAQFKKEARAYEELRQSYERDLSRYNLQVDTLHRKPQAPAQPSDAR